MKFCLLLLLALFLSVPFQAYATDGKTAGFRIIVGAAAFLDEVTPLDHFVIGGAGIIGITPRLRIEPQFLYLDGPDTDRDISLTGNITYDLLVTDHAALYVVGGGGLLRQTEDFPSGSFSSNGGTVNGGLGLRFYITDQFFAAPEFRFGYEPLLQVLASAGYEF